jgi:hypothetical protein
MSHVEPMAARLNIGLTRIKLAPRCDAQAADHIRIFSSAELCHGRGGCPHKSFRRRLSAIGMAHIEGVNS